MKQQLIVLIRHGRNCTNNLKSESSISSFMGSEGELRISGFRVKQIPYLKVPLNLSLLVIRLEVSHYIFWHLSTKGYKTGQNPVSEAF